MLQTILAFAGRQRPAKVVAEVDYFPRLTCQGHAAQRSASVLLYECYRVDRVARWVFVLPMFLGSQTFVSLCQ